MAKKENKKSNKKKIAYNITLAILICIFIGSAGYLAFYFLQSKHSEDQFEELETLIDEYDPSAQVSGDSAGVNPEDTVSGITFVDVDGVQVQARMEKIYRKNHDFVGWLSIEDTKISYPVMQTPEDEEYYIRRDFYGESSSAGTLFADTESDIKKPSDNILIYGHNMKTGTMFHDLLKYEDASFYNNHKYIQFDTIYGDGTYEVIAAFRTKIRAEDEAGFRYYHFFNAEDASQFDDYVKNCKDLTPYDISTNASYGDTLLTLSTCAYHTTNGRFVVVAKKIAP
ncbi:MAG: class B sortase [Wujia sp.]